MSGGNQGDQRFYQDFSTHRPSFSELYAQRKAQMEGRSGARFRLYYLLQELSAIHRATPIRSILELGTGNGVNLALVHDLLHVEECWGTDVIPPSPEMPSYIHYVQRDCSSLRAGLPRADFSVVLMIEVIEHLWDPDTCLEQVRSVLEPGGKLVLTTPNLSSGVNRVALLLGYQPIATEVSSRRTFGNPGPGPVVGHIRVFTFRALKEFVTNYGFTIEKAYTIPLGGSICYESIVGPTAPPQTRGLARMVAASDRMFARLGRTLGTNSVLVLSRTR